MAFNWKSLFIEPTEAEKAAALEEERLAKLAEAEAQKPKSQPLPNQPQNTSIKMSTSGDAFNEVLAVYEKGFEGLNQDGYDFFELYKSVQAVGADNPQAYQMAFAMGESIKPDLSKSFLLEKANNYVAEIEKVHAKYADVGAKKKADLANQLNSEKGNLSNAIKSLESQIASLQAQLNIQKAELSQIDKKFEGPIAEMEERIGANDGAKQTILSSIQKVINGINQNL
jgi:hypothetical protein